MSEAIKEVIREFNKLAQIGQLAPSEFAEEGGLADRLVSNRDDREKLNSTQLRKVFQQIKGLEREVRKKKEGDQFDRSRLLNLMPMLAYAAGRGLLPLDFYNLLRGHLLNKDKLKTNQDFLRTAKFLEAVMAYHKYRSSEQGR